MAHLKRLVAIRDGYGGFFLVSYRSVEDLMLESGAQDVKGKYDTNSRGHMLSIYLREPWFRDPPPGAVQQAPNLREWVTNAI